MRVVAFTKYDRENASTRQRFLQYRPSLAQAGIALDYRPLLDDAYVRSLSTGEHWPRSRLVKSYARRIDSLLRGPSADLLWVHTEFFPYLPAGFEKLALRRGVPVVVDWDDANFLKYNESGNPLVTALLSGKLEKLLGGAAAATCGNHYLRDYAAQHCADSRLFPTVVDTDVYRPSPSAPRPLTIGWMGSPSNWPNVRPVLPLLQELCASGKVRFRVIGAGVKAEADRFEGMELVRWAEDSEVAEVQGFDIGIMPLVNAPFERGKSAYKLIQYMACAVPAVASPIGANAYVLPPQAGIQATDLAEWKDALEKLIADPALRRRLGEAGRRHAIEHYSLQAYAPRLIALFRELSPRADQLGGMLAKKAT